MALLGAMRFGVGVLPCVYGPLHVLFLLSLQTLYTYPDNWRAYKPLIAAQYSGVPITVASSAPEFQFGVTNKTPEFLKKFPLGKVRSSDSCMCCRQPAKPLVTSIGLFMVATKGLGLERCVFAAP